MKFKQAGIFLYHAVQEVKEVKWEGETGYSGSHICLCPLPTPPLFFDPFSPGGSAIDQKCVVRENNRISLSPLSLPLSLSAQYPRQPMHCPSVLTEHVSPNLAGIFLLDPVLEYL